jgi:hypothetical protein
MKRDLDELANKIEWEGGLGNGAFLYFGDSLPTYYRLTRKVRDAWKRAYDAIEDLKALLPEPRGDS